MLKYLRFSNNKTAFIVLSSAFVITIISLLFTWHKVMIDLYVFCAGLLTVSILAFLFFHLLRVFKYKSFSNWKYEVRYKWYFHFYISSKQKRAKWRYVVRDNIVENNIYHQLKQLDRVKELSGFKKLLKYKTHHFNKINTKNQERFDNILYCSALDILTDIIHAATYSQDSELLIDILKKPKNNLGRSWSNDSKRISKSNKKMNDSIKINSKRFSEIVNAYVHLTEFDKLDVTIKDSNKSEFENKLLDVRSMITKTKEEN